MAKIGGAKRGNYTKKEACTLEKPPWLLEAWSLNTATMADDVFGNISARQIAN